MTNMKDMLKIPMLILSLLCAAACSNGGAHEGVLLKAPADVSVIDYGASSVLVTWTNTSEGHAGTVIERSDDAVKYRAVATLGKDDVEFVDRKLTDGKEYHYRLYAFAGSAKSEYAETDHVFHATLPAPTSFKAELGEKGLLLTWSDNCDGEDGYVLSKKTGTEDLKDWKFLDPNATEFLDEGVKSGNYVYTLQAYSGSMRSDEAKVEFKNMGLPQISDVSGENSSYMVTVDFKLADDGGEPCDVGICWSEDNTAPTTKDEVFVMPSKATTDKWAYGNATTLEYGKKYNVRAFATNSSGTTYSRVFSMSLAEEPKAITPNWTRITDYNLPDEVRLYSTSVNLSGGNANIWYAIADLSTGKVELLADKAASLTTVGKYITDNASNEEFYVMVNGGYFASPAASYSYVAKRGQRLASNIKALTRVYSYTVTRGAFGVDADQKPSIHWIYESGSTTLAYDRPLPVVNGEKPLTPSGSYPSKAFAWDNYSGMGGAPVLLKDGRICFDHLLTKEVRYKTNYELLQDDIFGPRVRPPRTAVGYTADGKVVIMVCDGRGAGGSYGATLPELAMLMKGVGCTDALNLDGGGSSVICAGEDGKAINSPSDGSQRKVISYIGFVKRK